MTSKEIKFIKRQSSVKKSTATEVYGYYVSASGDELSSFCRPIGQTDITEATLYLETMRTVLAPQLGVKSFNINFSSGEVQYSQQHKTLMTLLESKLKDEDARNQLFKSIAASFDMKTNFMILLTYETIDLPGRRGEGSDSEDTFSCFLCSICPVIPGKPVLGFDADTGTFVTKSTGWHMDNPIAGFMFPAFHDRAKDIYGGLFYAKKCDTASQQILRATFGNEHDFTQQSQTRESFAEVMMDALGPDCTIQRVNQIRSDISAMQSLANMTTDEDEELLLGPAELEKCLEKAGISKDRLDVFKQSFEKTFGANVSLPPADVLETHKVLINAGFCTVKVEPEFANHVDVRNIDGARCIVIRADKGGIQLNGIPVS